MSNVPLSEDRLYANLPVHQRRINKAREYVSRCLSVCKKPAVSISGGKDSSVLLGLVMEQKPDAVVTFYDSGAELPETFETIERLEKRFGFETIIIEPEWNMIRLIEHAKTLPEGEVLAPGEFKRQLIENPSKYLCKELGIDLFFVGLRKEESTMRLFGLSQMREPVYFNRKLGYHIGYPIKDLKGDDVFAYAAVNGIPMHPFYFDERIDVPRNERRVSSWAGDSTAHRGRWMWLKITHPELHEKLRELDKRVAWYF